MNEIILLTITTSLGSFDIELDDGLVKQKISMKSDSKAILVRDLVWREMTNFTTDAVMLVLNDRVYSEDRVIRNYSTFKKLVEEKRFFCLSNSRHLFSNRNLNYF